MNPLVLKNIMIDLETFGKRPNGLIVSIGAVCFSSSPEDIEANRIFSGNPAEQYHQLLSLDAATAETRFKKNPETMTWWEKEQPVAYAKLQGLMRQSSFDVEGLMAHFLGWLKPYCDAGYNVIGNSPSFDLVLIENACDTVGLPFPVPYRAETDYRMLTDLVWGPANKPRPGPNDGHDALFDAKFQAQVYCEALQKISTWRQLALAA